MSLFEKEFNVIKNSKNSEEINDFLIKLGRTPSYQSLEFLDFFIDNLNAEVFERIKLNLIYVIGEIGKTIVLDEKYLEFLKKSYDSSDQWIRQEILETFSKIVNNKKFSNEICDLIGSALNEQYLHIKISSLKTLIKIENLSEVILKNVIKNLDTENSEILDTSTKILRKHINNELELFRLLDKFDTLQILNKKSIRTLLFIFFRSESSLECFKQLVEGSNWNLDHKKRFFKEIETYNRILAHYL